MIIAMWYPPFTMMVERYCAKHAREELEAGGDPLPFPGKEFHVWDISLRGADHVKTYLDKHKDDAT